MVKRLSLLLAAILLGALSAGCDSSNNIATVTARAIGTNTVNAIISPPAPPTVALPTLLPGATAAPTTAALPAAPSAVSSTVPAASTAVGTLSGTTAATSVSNGATGAATTASTSPATVNAPAAVTAVPTQAATSIATAVSSIAPTMAATSVATSIATAPGTAPAAVILAPIPLTLTAGAKNAAGSSGASAVAVTAAPTGSGVARDTGWFNEATMYSLFVRSFRDSNGDGIGDLQGVIDGLDYIQSLGVDTIWLLPVFKSPSYHGYDTIDYYAVNPDYGTNDDLLRLIKEIHRRKMHILLDYVVNHTSDKHPYFVDAYKNPSSPYSEYYTWFNPEHTDYATFASVSEMPKLNYDSPKVRKFVTDIALHWLDPLNDGNLDEGVDGYRCDVASGPPRSFWQELRTAMTAKNPRSILLGELWMSAPQDIAPYLRNNGLDSAFDFPLYLTMTGTFDKNGDGVFSGLGSLSLAKGLIRSTSNFYPPEAQLVRFINNHDTNRVMSDVQGNMARARAAGVFLLTLPGIPIIYYGEEVGMKGEKGPKPWYDAYRREPLPWYASLSGKGQTTWFAPPDRYNLPNSGTSIEEQDGKPDSLLTLYRALGKLRKDHAALRIGKFDLPELSGAQQSLYMLRHWDAKELYVTVINFSDQPITFTPDAKTWTADQKAYTPTSSTPILGQSSAADGSNWTLQPSGYAVFSAS